jgi:tetratricopeptide (TPR) repeat protein
MELEQATSTSRRGQLLSELGQILREHLGRRDEAIAAYEAARTALGDERLLIQPLFELYQESGRLENAADVGEALARGAGRMDPQDLAQEAVKLAEVNLAVGRDERALIHLERAETALPGYEPAQPLLVDLYEKAQRWDDAFRVLAAIARTTTQGSSDWMANQARMGRIARLSGHHDQARQIFEEILVEQPKHNEALRQLAAILEAHEEFAAAIHHLQQVEIPDDEARLTHRNRIVDLARRAQDDDILERSLSAVLELCPADHRCLTLMLDLQSRGNRWTEAIATIERLAETAAGKPELRAKYFSAAAKIFRDVFNDLEGCVRYFEKVLDEDWTNLTVFASLDRILTTAREYTLQERVYRHMIFRVTNKGRIDLEVQLWHALGEIYRSRLGRFDEAAEAFAAANRLEPDNIERKLILAELYQAIDKPAEALACHRELLKQQPDRIASLQALREIYSANGLYDSAFCICSALVARSAAHPEEQQFFEDWLPIHQPVIKAMSSLSNEEWLRLLRHPDEDPYVSGIFETILSLLIEGRVRPLRDFGLSSETSIDTSQSSSVLAQQFITIVRAFGLTHAPQLHMLRNNPGTMTFALTSPISSIMGSAMAQLPETQRVFLMARHLAYYQGGRYVAVIFPSRSELQSALLTIVAAVTGQDQSIPATSRKSLNQFRSSLQRSPQILERLSKVVRKFLARGGKADFDRWLKGVDLTTCRAAALMVADPRVAAAALRHDTSTIASVSPKERLEDLVRFVATEEYVQLRKTLGVQVG